MNSVLYVLYNPISLAIPRTWSPPHCSSSAAVGQWDKPTPNHSQLSILHAVMEARKFGLHHTVPHQQLKASWTKPTPNHSRLSVLHAVMEARKYGLHHTAEGPCAKPTPNHSRLSIWHAVMEAIFRRKNEKLFYIQMLSDLVWSHSCPLTPSLFKCPAVLSEDLLISA